MLNKKRFVIGSDFSIHQDKERLPPQKDNKNFLLEKYINIGYYLLIPLLLGVFLGLIIDNFLHTKPLFTIVLIIGGTVFTFYNLFKLTKF